MDRRSALAAAAVTALAAAAASGRSAVGRPADAPRPSPSRPSVVETDDGAGLFYNDWGTGKPVPFRSELARGGEARGFSALTNRGGADFMTFAAASGDSCVGIRRYGPSMGAEYGWVLNAVRCEPGGRPTSDADIDRFIAGTTVRSS